MGGSGADPREGRKNFKKFIEFGHVKLKLKHFSKFYLFIAWIWTKI